MQGPRFLLAVLLLALNACAPPSPPETPSTPEHGPVAEYDAGIPSAPAEPAGNQRIRSFDEAKRALIQIYERHRIDLYCGCAFVGLKVDLATCGYAVAHDPVRAGRVEWEHAVAAASFGHAFAEWTEGSDRCVDGHGKRFKGRRCAETSAEFSRMEGDLHNLFPVVGEVNGLRSDLPMGVLDGRHRDTKVSFQFGACKSEIVHGVFLPRAEVRGDLARATLYMATSYPTRLTLSDDQRALFERWSRDDPPDEWERERNRAILARQGNANPFIDR